MTDLEIEQIKSEANWLINKDYPLLHNEVKDTTIKYILKAMNSLGYKVKKGSLKSNPSASGRGEYPISK